MKKRPFLKFRQKLYLPFKRFLDFFFSLLLLISLSWLLLIIAILIKCTSKGPVFFKQDRIGKFKKHFFIYKFRTMYVDAPQNVPTEKLDHPEQYTTKFGNFLRKTSLDELPQIINILLGHMSFIGPRPALFNQDDLIAERDKYHANNIIPGLSGYAQTHGRDMVTIEEKAKLDGHYVNKFGLFMDIYLFFLTFIQVIRRKDLK